MECGICLSNIIIQGTLVNICKHEFCFKCIIRWAKIQTVCPFCKREFTQIRNEDTNESITVQTVQPIVQRLDEIDAAVFDGNPNHPNHQISGRSVAGRSMRPIAQRSRSSALQRYREERETKQSLLAVRLASLREKIQSEKELLSSSSSSSSSSSATTVTSTTTKTTTTTLQIHIERNKETLRNSDPSSATFQTALRNRKLIEELQKLDQEELIEELLKLGYQRKVCKTAALKCSSLDTAIEWIQRQQRVRRYKESLSSSSSSSRSSSTSTTSATSLTSKKKRKRKRQEDKDNNDRKAKDSVDLESHQDKIRKKIEEIRSRF